MTPLHLAAEKPDTDEDAETPAPSTSIAVLLSKGANIEAKDHVR